MAITIIDECRDAGTSPVCRLNIAKREGEGEGNGSSEPIDEEETPNPPFHKHCQKTVCSAYGYSGLGATWNILYPGVAGDLANLQKFVTKSSSPTRTWHGYFSKNEENVTQDLRSILELMNVIAGDVATMANWKVMFKDCGGKSLDGKTINPWSGESQDYEFVNFGRNIELTLDGNYKFKFHTIRPADQLGYGAEELSIEFPKKDLTINFNGEPIAKVEDIYMKQSETVDINQDFNKVPCRYAASDVSITGGNHVFRHYEETASYVSPVFNIDVGYLKDNAAQTSPIVEWEYHLRNITNSADGVVPAVPGHVVYAGYDPGNGARTFVVKVDNQDYFYKIIGLTDKMYVDPGWTNVYVFRADMHSSARIVTYSLAYSYPGGRPPS